MVRHFGNKWYKDKNEDRIIIIVIFLRLPQDLIVIIFDIQFIYVTSKWLNGVEISQVYYNFLWNFVLKRKIKNIAPEVSKFINLMFLYFIKI